LLKKATTEVVHLKAQEVILVESEKNGVSDSMDTVASIEPTQTIELDEVEPNWETDSQKTEVLAQLEPLMTSWIESSQTESASLQSLYYLDEIDNVLQYYDVDLAAGRHRESREAKSEPEINLDPNISYYLSNFMAILTVVEEKDRHLFSEEELRVFEVLRTKSSANEQRLFSRLLYRKGPWFQCSKLVYRDIFDMNGTIAGLLANGIFEEPNSLLDILPTLSNVQLRQLTKSGSSLKREQLLTTASRWVATQRTVDGKPINTPKEVGQCIRIKEFVDILFKRVHRLFFLNHAEDQTTLILIHTGQIKFPTYLIPDQKSSSAKSSSIVYKDRWVKDADFSYELSVSVKEEEGPTPPPSPSASQVELRDFLFPKSDLKAHMNLSNVKNLPEELENVAILRKTGFYSVFKTRAELDEYEAALEMSHDLVNLMGAEIDLDNDTTENDQRKKQQISGKKLNDEATVTAALVIVEEAVMKYQLKKSQQTSQMDWEAMDNETLGSHLFLKRFTSTWVYTSIIWIGVSLLERRKRYSEAIAWLKMLLNDFEVNRGRRGEWWIRLIFDVAHMKKIDHAIELCCEAINDESCRPQHLLKLYDKLRILIKAKEREETKAEKEKLKKAKESAKAKKTEKSLAQPSSPLTAATMPQSELPDPHTPKRSKRLAKSTTAKRTGDQTSSRDLPTPSSSQSPQRNALNFDSDDDVILLSPRKTSPGARSANSSPKEFLASPTAPNSPSNLEKKPSQIKESKIPLPNEPSTLDSKNPAVLVSMDIESPLMAIKPIMLSATAIDEDIIPGRSKGIRRRHEELVIASTPLKPASTASPLAGASPMGSSSGQKTPSIRHTSPVRYHPDSDSSPVNRLFASSNTSPIREHVKKGEDLEEEEFEVLLGSSKKKPKLKESSELDADFSIATPSKGKRKRNQPLGEDEDLEEEGNDATDLPPNIALRMQALGVPMPEKLNSGVIETIYGTIAPKPTFGASVPSSPRSPFPGQPDLRKSWSTGKFGAVGAPLGGVIPAETSGPNWGVKTTFVDFSGKPCGVEEYSLQHYQLIEGWPRGMHCEGSPYYAIFILLFWDIIFDATVPYVFQTPYQDAPLDLTTEVFYMSRKSAIDQRLKDIYFSVQGDETSWMLKKLNECYYQWHGRSARGMDWERWKIRDLQDISRCLGGPVVALLCERFALDYRFTHSGLPDLLLWNPETNRAKLVEVKGPNDKLSEKQKIWIDALATRGCDIATLYVKKDIAPPLSPPPVKEAAHPDNPTPLKSSQAPQIDP
jgi:hypothetical protein